MPAYSDVVINSLNHGNSSEVNHIFLTRHNYNNVPPKNKNTNDCILEKQSSQKSQTHFSLSVLFVILWIIKIYIRYRTPNKIQFQQPLCFCTATRLHTLEWQTACARPNLYCNGKSADWSCWVRMTWLEEDRILAVRNPMRQNIPYDEMQKMPIGRQAYMILSYKKVRIGCVQLCM